MRASLRLTQGVIVIVCGGILATACDEHEYAPVGDGLRWEYEVSVQNDFAGASSYRVVDELQGRREEGGKKYFRRLTQDPQLGITESLVRVDRGNLYVRREGEPEIVDLPRLEVGKRWVHRSRGDSTVFHVEARERVETPYRTFEDCFRVRARDGHGDEAVSHYCAGVGLAKQELRFGPTREVQLLTSFSGRGDEGRRERDRRRDSAEGHLSSAAAAEALQRWANSRGGGIVTVVGVQELTDQKRALARIRMDGVPVANMFGRSQPTNPNTTARAEFTSYNERGWVLTRVSYGSFSDYAWDTDIPVEQD